jgi:hypothetical protein
VREIVGACGSEVRGDADRGGPTCQRGRGRVLDIDSGEIPGGPRAAYVGRKGSPGFFSVFIFVFSFPFLT